VQVTAPAGCAADQHHQGRVGRKTIGEHRGRFSVRAALTSVSTCLSASCGRAAQQPSKPLPPSKAARLELTVVWQALVVFLTSLGTLAACCRRFTVGCAARQCQPASSFMLPLYLPQPHVPWPSGLPTRCSCSDGEPFVPLLSGSTVPCAGGCSVLRRHIGPH
jgi:hypothetical protein